MNLLAHGIGGRTDLPLPSWQVAWAAGFAVASAFIVVNLYWQTSRLELAAVGRPVTEGSGPSRLVLALRGLAVVTLGVVLVAAWTGPMDPLENLSVGALLIWFWVGLQVASFLVGDLWGEANPYLAVARRPRAVLASRWVTDDSPAWLETRWPAVVSVASFLWFELAYHGTTNPRAVAAYLTAYSVVMVAGAVRWGAAWIRCADGFAVLFELLGAMAPLHRDEHGVVRARLPLAGLRALEVRRGHVAFVLVVLGSTTFDGFTRTGLWTELTADRTGWTSTAIHSIGLAVVASLVASLFVTTTWIMGRIAGESTTAMSDRFGLSVVPIAAAYTVAHYFSLLVLEGQRTIAHLSDPFGRGWDLFGTADWVVVWTAVSPDAIAWVQATAIAVGHVLAVIAAHDIALAHYDRRLAARSQYPMLVAMVAYTVIGLFLLLGD